MAAAAAGPGGPGGLILRRRMTRLALSCRCGMDSAEHLSGHGTNTMTLVTDTTIQSARALEPDCAHSIEALDSNLADACRYIYCHERVTKDLANIAERRTTDWNNSVIAGFGRIHPAEYSSITVV